MSPGLLHNVGAGCSVRLVEAVGLDGATLVVTDRPDVTAPGVPLIEVAGPRPSPGDVAAATAALAASGPGRVLAIGSGAPIDTAKLALHESGRTDVDLVLVPCGGEPWRAFAPFGVVLHGAGDQRTTGVAIPPGTEAHLAVSQLAGADLGVAAVDTIVQSFESLLSTQAHPYARALATAAVVTAVEGLVGAAAADAPAAVGRANASIVVAGALATQAFMTTRLGLAHAIATHLAARTCDAHDRINAIVGRTVLATWGGEPGLEPLARWIDATLGTAGVLAGFERLLDLAGLPHRLSDDGHDWEAVEAVLPLSATSSGLQTLPQLLGPGELEKLALAAWSG